MDITGIAARLERLNPRVAATAERLALAVPAVRARLDREYGQLLAGVEGSVKPYRGEVASFPRLPEHGLGAGEALATVEDLAGRERARWRDGLASGATLPGRWWARSPRAGPRASCWP